MKGKIFLLAAFTVLLAAATTPARHTAPALSKSAQRGLALARGTCSHCHATTGDQGSPNPEAPPFPDIANRDGLTRATLAQFLKDAHNFPAAMNFTLTRQRALDLSAYMITLRRPGYRPQI